MPFRRILNELVTTCDGATAAIFLDYEGETVELLSNGSLDKDDLKIIGAYQGIFLTRLKTLCERIEGGEPDRFKIEFAGSCLLSYDLKDGYYVVLVTEPRINEGLAWQKLLRCRNQLLAEM